MMDGDTLYLFDNQKRLIDVINPRDVLVSEQTSEINSVITHVVQARYHKSSDKARFFGMRDIDDPDVFHMYKIDKHTITDNTFTYNGTHVLFDDLKGRGGIVRGLQTKNAPIETVLSEILSGTGWEIGNIESERTVTVNFKTMTKLEAFWDFLKKANVEFYPEMEYSGGMIVRKVVHIHDEIGSDNGKWYEYGDKIMTVIKEEERVDIATAFYGFGSQITDENGDKYELTFKDVEWSVANGDPVDKPLGQEYVVVSNNYVYEDGSHRFGIIHRSNTEDPEDLLYETYYEGLEQSRPKVHFKSNVTDDDTAHLGERVRIIRDDINIRYSTRIFKMVRNFKNRKVKTFEFGDKLVQSRAEREKATKEALDELKDVIENFEPPEGGGGGLPEPPDGYMVVVVHGTDANRKRPDVDGATRVYWEGSVAPINAVQGDLWIGGPIG